MADGRYRWFLDNVGIADTDSDVGIPPDMFTKSMFMLPFDLTPRGKHII